MGGVHFKSRGPLVVLGAGVGLFAALRMPQQAFFSPGNASLSDVSAALSREVPIGKSYSFKLPPSLQNPDRFEWLKGPDGSFTLLVAKEIKDRQFFSNMYFLVQPQSGKQVSFFSSPVSTFGHNPDAFSGRANDVANLGGGVYAVTSPGEGINKLQRTGSTTGENNGYESFNLIEVNWSSLTSEIRKGGSVPPYSTIFIGTGTDGGRVAYIWNKEKSPLTEYTVRLENLYGDGPKTTSLKLGVPTNSQLQANCYSLLPKAQGFPQIVPPARITSDGFLTFEISPSVARYMPGYGPGSPGTNTIVSSNISTGQLSLISTKANALTDADRNKNEARQLRLESWISQRVAPTSDHTPSKVRVAADGTTANYLPGFSGVIITQPN